MQSSPPAAPGPLAGLRVIELGTLIAGPFCTRILAEFGAEVIKIEAPDGGDPLRTWRKVHQGTSLWWFVQSRNKKSVTVNLKSRSRAGDRAQARARRRHRGGEFPSRCDGELGTGLRPAVRRQPGLVMVRLSGYGQTGPYRDQPGFGAIGEAMGGIRFVTGYPDRPPVRAGISLGDSVAALYGVIGALMAVHARQRNGGRGQVVDVALVRGRVQPDGEPAAGVRCHRLRARPQRRLAARHRSVEHLHHARRQVPGDRRQRRQHLQAPDERDRTRGSRQRSGARGQRGPRQAHRGARRGDRRVGGRRATWTRRSRCSRARAGAGGQDLRRRRTSSATSTIRRAACSSSIGSRTAPRSSCRGSCPSCRTRRAGRAGSVRGWARTPTRSWANSVIVRRTSRAADKRGAV